MTLLFTGRVMRIDPNGPVVRVPLLGRDALWGPLPSGVGGLAPGEQVIVGQLGTSRDQLVVLCRLDPTATGMTGTRLDVVEAAVADQRVRLTSVESRAAALTRSDASTELALTSLRGRMGAVENAASALPALIGEAGDLATQVGQLRADLDALADDVTILNTRLTAHIAGGDAGGGTDPGGGDPGGGTTPPPSSPGKMFSLSKWELTLPVGTAGNPDDIYYSGSPNLDTFVDPSYFFVGGDATAGFYTEMVAPVTGTGPDGRTIVTTSGASGASRCEFREMEGVGPSGTKSAWTFADDKDHILTVTMVVDPTGAAPRKEVIIGQIHGTSGTPPLYLAANFNTTLKLTAFKNGASSGAGDFLSGQVGPTVKFSYRLAKTAAGRVQVFYCLGDDTNLPATPQWDWPVSDFTDATGNYFKWGVYNKSPIDDPDAAGTSQVRIYKAYLGAVLSSAKQWSSAQLDAATVLTDAGYTAATKNSRTLYLATGVTTPSGTVVNKVVALTQTSYDALSVKAADTFYLITATPLTITTVTTLTQAAYNALTVKSANTAYLFIG